MKNRIRSLLCLGLALVALSPLATWAQGTKFTYQGRLNFDTGTATNGLYDMTFTLWDTAVAGATLGSNNGAVPVTNGLFTVQLDFGAVFNGAPRWIQIAVKPAGSPDPAETLAQRQAVLPTPYAIYAGTAAGISTNVTIVFNPPSGPPFNVGNSNKVPNLNADLLDGLDSSQFWKTGGNGGTTAGVNFLGTTDGQALELKVNGQRALRIEPSAGAPSLIGGGSANSVGTGAQGATIAGGSGNRILTNSSSSSQYSAISGGQNNDIEPFAYWASIGGGRNNTVSYDGDRVFIGAGDANLVGTNADNAFIGAGNNNSIGADAAGASIVGGLGNSVVNGADNSAIGGGFGNRIQGGSQASVIGGGRQNQVGSFGSGGNYNAIGGGQTNAVWSGDHSTIGGGGNNFMANSASYCTIAGGRGNEMTSENAIYHIEYATIAGGDNNHAGGKYSMIPGGSENVAGEFCFAAGHRARAVQNGCFVWADNVASGFTFESSVANEFAVRCTGGARFVSAISGGGAPTAGVRLAAGGTAWAVISDKNQKKNFQPVDGKEVLDKLAAMPVSQWNYKWETDTEVPHIGPMAQDFKHAFYPGRDDTVITTQETDGVALAAIQGLNTLVKEKDARIEALEKRLADLEKLVREQAAAPGR